MVCFIPASPWELHWQMPVIQLGLNDPNTVRRGNLATPYCNMTNRIPWVSDTRRAPYYYLMLWSPDRKSRRSQLRHFCCQCWFLKVCWTSIWIVHRIYWDRICHCLGMICKILKDNWSVIKGRQTLLSTAVRVMGFSVLGMVAIAWVITNSLHRHYLILT